jgi:diguanylate cyclase (GGDEF)-like protein/PAS domain S-box-containing protein
VGVAVEVHSVTGHGWGAVALGAGIGLALMLRYGVPATLGVAAGLSFGQLAFGVAVGVALASTAAMMVALAISLAVLRRGHFHRRLERTRDIVMLVAVIALIAAPAATIPLALGRLISGDRWAGLMIDGTLRGAGLATGMLLAALPGLLIDRRIVSWNPTPVRVVAAALLASLTITLAVLPLTTVAHTVPWAQLSWWGAHAALLATLAVGGSAGAALVLLAAAALMPPLAATFGITAAGSGRAFIAWVGGPVASMLVLLLVAHGMRAAAAAREQRWEWALDGSRLGVVDWQLGGGETFVSAAWARLIGHAGGPWSPAAWLQQVHPDDRAALAAAIAGVESGRDGSARVELRVRTGQAWQWREVTLLVVEREPDGVPSRLVATALDIDDRHEAQLSQRLSASLLQQLHEGLLVTDRELRVLDVNPAYTRILGVTREELIGQVPALLRPNPTDPLARQQRAAMWVAVNATGRWSGELLERRRSGELCTLQATVSSVAGPVADESYRVVVISDVTEQRSQREQLERQAHFDELTRLPNRARLAELLADAMLAADRDGYLLVVCYLDLDHFKPVNDRHGHAAGDRLLIDLAARLRSALRSRETWADAAARLGGDEFVLLLRAGTIEEGRLAVERVLRVVAQPYVIEPTAEPVQVTASMGATVYPIDRSDADTLLRHADHAMYGAKQSGRNGYLFFDPEHRRRTEERALAIGRVQEALDRSEFVLFYQPKVDMSSGAVLGLEALLRWEHPQHGLIAPMQFLPLIENTGLSSRVGDWALSQALEHLSYWRRAGADIGVSVNISARHLQEPDFALRLAELLARFADPLAAHLELEILETAAHADIDATSALLARCRAVGVRCALDDFGTGYSTLTYLKRLPVDTLKIDRSFVHHMLDDAQDRAIVEGVIGLARTFGCAVVAEGVESPAQARTLLDLGCHIGQGTGIAAPMPASAVTQWMRDYRGMFAIGPAPVAHGRLGAVE